MALVRVVSHQFPFSQGNAGSGKSWLITERIVPWLRAIHNVPAGEAGEDMIALTSSSGLSSMNIGGRTLHSWASIKRGLGKVIDILAGLSAAGRNRLLKIKGLVIDEGGMLPNHVMDLCNELLQAIRGNNLPWGGVQVIFVADMLQLGPIGELYEVTGGDVRHGIRSFMRRPPPWCFQARCWGALKFEPCLLTKNFRHAEPAWARVLDLVARGDVHTPAKWQEVRAALVAAMGNKVNPKSRRCTRLHCTKKEVRRVQEEAQAKLPGEAVRYSAYDEGHGLLAAGAADASDDNGAESDVFAFFQPQSNLQLKVGSKVMCIKNLSSGDRGGPVAPLLNGSIGRVIGFQCCKEVTDLPWFEESGLTQGEGRSWVGAFFIYSIDTVLLCKDLYVPA